MRESASTDLREPQWSNPLGPPGPELSPASASGRSWVWSVSFMLLLRDLKRGWTWGLETRTET